MDLLITQLREKRLITFLTYLIYYRVKSPGKYFIHLAWKVAHIKYNFQIFAHLLGGMRFIKIVIQNFPSLYQCVSSKSHIQTHRLPLNSEAFISSLFPSQIFWKKYYFLLSLCLFCRKGVIFRCIEKLW